MGKNKKRKDKKQPMEKSHQRSYRPKPYDRQHKRPDGGYGMRANDPCHSNEHFTHSHDQRRDIENHRMQQFNPMQCNNYHDYHGNFRPQLDYGYRGRGQGLRGRGNSHSHYSGAMHRQPEYFVPFESIDEVEFSKELVRVVRHGKYHWLHMDSEGFVSVNKILRDAKFKKLFGNVAFEYLQYIVDSNNKKRFELKNEQSQWFIRAVQGHTVQVDKLNLTPITDPHQYPNVFHGTYFEAWDIIKFEGLNKMKRNHIHFAIGLPDDRHVISGMRKSSQLVIILDLEKAMKAGLKFVISSNNVILSEGDELGRIHPKFFRKVVQLKPFHKPLRFEVPPDYDDEPGSSYS